MSEQRELFSSSVLPDQTELKAHAALYTAREQASSGPPREPVLVMAPRRPIPQGGAAAARAMREQLIAERRAVVVEAAERFNRSEVPIPASSILRFRLSDLPKLIQAARDGDGPGKGPGKGAGGA